MDVALLTEIIEARTEQAELARKAEQMEARLAELEGKMLDQLEAVGITDIAIGGIQVQVKHGCSARMSKPRDEVLAAMRTADCDHMIYETWSASSVSAMFRHDKAPAALADVFEVNRTRTLKLKGI